MTFLSLRYTNIRTNSPCYLQHTTDGLNWMFCCMVELVS